MAGPCGARLLATARRQKPGRRVRQCWISTTRASADHARTALLSWATAAAAPDPSQWVVDLPATQPWYDFSAMSPCLVRGLYPSSKACCLPGREHSEASCCLAYQSSSFSPRPPSSTISCWAERSRVDARPLPLRPRLRASRRRSCRTVAMTKCARASSGSVATSSFHSVRDKRAASTSMLWHESASLLSDGGDWCLIPCLGFSFEVGRCSSAADVGAGAPKKSVCRRSASGLRATVWPFPLGRAPTWHSGYNDST